MLKLSMAALAAAGIFAVYSAPAFAATTMPRGGGTPTTPTCQVDCGGGGGEIDTPGDPFIPGFPEGGPDDDGGPDDGDSPGDPGDNPDDPNNQASNDPNYPGLTKGQVAELKRCLANLGHLPTVTEGQVNQFGQPYKVTLTPVCDVQFKSATEAATAIMEGGNANGLERAIRGNAAMTAKLGQTQYKAKDVVGIDFDAKGNAILFVHKKRG